MAAPWTDPALRGRLAALFELGIDPASLPSETLRRIRVIAAGTLGLALIAAFSIAQYALFGMREGALALSVTGGLAVANLAVLRRTRRPALAAHLGLSALAVMIVCAVAFGGGFGGSDFCWLMLLPVGAAVSTDARGALVWFGVALAILLTFFGLAEAGVELTNRIPARLQAGQLLFDRVTAMLGLAAIAVGFVVAQRRVERDLARANAELRGESGLVQLLTHGAVSANEALSLSEALRDSIAGICKVMGWAGGHAYLLNEEGVLEPCDVVTGEAVDSLEPLIECSRTSRFATGEGLPGRVLASGEVECIRDLRAHSGGPRGAQRRALARRVGVVAAVAAPIPVNGKVAGVLEFASREALPEGERLLEVLTLLGVQLGRVAERESLQDRLRQAQKIEAIGRLAAGLAHEINNPMAYVRSNLNLLRAQWEELAKDRDGNDRANARLDECSALLDECSEGVDRTVAIVRDVQEFSHAGRTCWEWLDLNEVLRTAIRVASPQARDGVEITSRLGELRTLRGSSTQLEQVFLNLVVNAIHAVGESGQIGVSSSTSGDFATVSVEDDGPGIAENALERLFEPFFTTKPVGQGTGLGLYISYEIVRNHGGEICVEQRPGRGARFVVQLPLE